MIVLHAAPVSWRYPNGVTEVVTASVAAQNAIPGYRAGLLITSREFGSIPVVGFPIFSARDGGRTSSGPLPMWLPQPFQRPDLVVFHSTFVPLHGALASRLRGLGIPYVICPHGGMAPEALHQKAWKKWLGRVWFFDDLVRHAVAIQYLSHGEAEKSGDWGRPVIIAGNGVHPPRECDLATPGRQSPRRFLFLGRLHIHHKGLDVLLEACRRARDVLTAHHVQISFVGPDVDGSRQTLQERIREWKLDPLVHLRDAVVGGEKRRLFQSADVFVHPSRTEGHPTAVLEALSFGLPVLVTPETNVAEAVAANRAGWITECDADTLAHDLRRLAEMPGTMLAEAGRAGREWVLRELTWDRVAARTVRKYRNLLQLARAA